jgi:amino acid adenylation domain-containing protein/thioester reductase-like protein
MSVLDTSKDLVALFLAQVKKTPDAIALEDVARKLTYSDLDVETKNLSEILRHHYGVGRNDLVGVLLSRSADYVIACLAALRAGGAFLVLELAYPPGLLASVIDDATPKVVITHTAHTGHLRADIPHIDLDTENLANVVPQDESELSPLPKDDDLDRLAFVSYSSGTTGLPKGIANPHRAPVRSYDLRFQLNNLNPGDRVACNVFFVWECLRPLLRGATVIAVPDEASYDPVALVDLLSKKEVTETLMTPTLLSTVLLRHPKIGETLSKLRSLWFNGEVVRTDLAKRAMAALPNVRLLNCYSASETHEIACGDIREMLKDIDTPVCPVGPPIEPDFTYILAESGERVGKGVTGELFVGGHMLASGYLNLPDTTAKAFIEDPFNHAPGARMYRTGDLARLLPSGLLEITGRVGAMIKLRGYSVVPAAVEGAIVKHLIVRTCAIVPYGDGLERQLVAYFVRGLYPQGRAPLQVDDAGYSPSARKALASHLAPYMVPALWVELPALPTHEVSGKVDVKRLPPPPNPRGTSSGKEDTTKRDSKTEEIAKTWADVLKIPLRVIQDRDFFDLGGHSLALAELARRLTEQFAVSIPAALLAGNPTLAGHLDVVNGRVSAVQKDLPAVLQADSTLPDDVKPAQGTKFCSLTDASTILLTGVTGYLGAFLLKSILESSSGQVVCLVRFGQPSGGARGEGMARLRKNLIDLGIWDDSILDRVEVLPGNLGQKRLGLSQDDYEDLASRVEVIIHAGATVNLVYPYAAMRSANVVGTRDIVRFAAKCGATLHHISTNGVLPASAEGYSEDSTIEIKDVADRLADGYGQTKWVAEQLVTAAGKRGLPVRIYRPGTISGHTTLGSTNTFDLLTALFVESLQLGYAPDIEGWLAEMTPVDFVSQAVTTIANHNDTQQVIFHLGEPNPPTAREVFASFKELGYPTRGIPWDEWVSLWNEKIGTTSEGGNDATTAGILRRGMPNAAFLNDVTVLKDPITKPILAEHNLSRPKIDSTLLKTYARDFYARGWLSKPPRSADGNKLTQAQKKRPLYGKTAIVTGASSGIGAAVATALAYEGASVVLAARRTDALQALRTSILAKTPSAKLLVQRTDVTDAASVSALVKETESKLGPVDILVSCAGVMYFTMMANVQAEQWRQTVDVNCHGLLHCLASTVPGMLSRGKGHIVAISSDAGRKVFPGLGVYSASKFFVEATLQALRVETAGTGLRVTSVQPGNVATDLLGMSTDKEALEKYGEPTGAKVLEPEDVARSIMYALSQPEHVGVNEIMIEPREEPC